MTTEDIRDRAESYFAASMNPAHDWHHVQRVEALAEQLLDRYPDADDRTVGLAVLLHDIGRAREDRGEIEDHAAWGAQEARKILAEYGVDEQRVDAVCHAIAIHRYSTDPEPETLEAERDPSATRRPNREV